MADSTDTTTTWSVAPPIDGLSAETLVEVFRATVRRCPDRLAIDAADGQLTYGELEFAADAVAARLWAEGIGAGDRVGVRIPGGSRDLYVAILGVLCAGAAYVPVDADDPETRAEVIWSGAGVCGVLTAPDTLDLRALPAGDVGAPQPDDDAWVIFTSGSTGTPKGVAVAHRSAAAFVSGERALWTVHPDDRVLAGLSVGFDASCEEMWLAWGSGAALVPARRAIVRSGTDLGPWLAEHGITVVSTVPTLAAFWDDAVLAGVRLVILGGEALPDELGWRLAATAEVWNTYGPTEATVVATAARVLPGSPVVIGAPLHGWEVAVVDGSGEPVAPGVEGELVIAGVGLARYLDPELDRERFAPLPALGWARAYRTGDLVRQGPSGLEFVGRRDEQVKIAGRRIELGEVEAHARAVPGVTAAAAAVRPTPAGNTVLVVYVTGDVAPDRVRAALRDRLPAGVAPVIAPIAEMPVSGSGKLARAALPWPLDEPAAVAWGSETERWLAGLWRDQLGIVPATDDDFFALGGTSMAAAKLVSEARRRYPCASVADVYAYRTLGAMARRLEELSTGAAGGTARSTAGPRSRRVRQLIGGLVLFAFGALEWALGLVVFCRIDGRGIGAHVSWWWIIAVWVLLFSVPGGVGLVLLARRLLLRDLAPGRYPRTGGLAARLWFVDRLDEAVGLDHLAGTPWAARAARLLGSKIGPGARLGTMPPVTGLLSVGAGATLEGEVDAAGWWIDGDDIVVAPIHVGEGARIGTRASLVPGAEIGAGAEVEPGSVIDGHVPAGEIWTGSPAVRLEQPASTWPEQPPTPSRFRRAWAAMYAVGLAFGEALPFLAIACGIVVLVLIDPGVISLAPSWRGFVMGAPAAALTFVVTYAVLAALAVRVAGLLVRPGWHADDGGTAWGLWFAEQVMSEAEETLFPLYASQFTRPWLRLAGVRIGPRTEVSTAVGLTHLVRIGRESFLTDDVVLSGTRSHHGWIHVSRTHVGDRSFLGNGALLKAGTTLGDDSLVGLLSSPPLDPAPGTSWLGTPGIEIPRVAEATDRTRTTHPPRRLRFVRAGFETVRILLPSSVSFALGLGVLSSLARIGSSTGSLWLTILVTPVVAGVAAVTATLVAVAIKWILIGRYRPGVHPLWSTFVWRDEIVNSAHELLAGDWLLESFLGTPVVPLYLRLMGAQVGRGVWFESMAISEFDLARLGDDVAVNRGAVVETHLFHDRLMRLGPAVLESGSSLGPNSAVLPDTVLGEGCTVGARSFVMRGERLPAGTRWQGAPVVAS